MRLIQALAALGPSNTPILLRYAGRFSYHPPSGATEAAAASQTPLILCGGTSQSLSSWSPHIKELSRDRLVITYECVGQGPFPPPPHVSCAMSEQVNRLKAFMDSVELRSPASVDMAGLSFGARVCLAASRLGRTRRCHLSGVSVVRDAEATRILEEWRGLVRDGNLERFAHSIIEVSYSPAFRERNRKWLPKWVEFVKENNTIEGLGGLLNESHAEDDFGVLPSLQNSKSVNRFLVGEHDVLCGGGGNKVHSSLERLLAVAGEGDTGMVVRGIGHGVPIEASKEWRTDLLEWLKCDI